MPLSHELDFNQDFCKRLMATGEFRFLSGGSKYVLVFLKVFFLNFYFQLGYWLLFKNAFLGALFFLEAFFK